MKTRRIFAVLCAVMMVISMLSTAMAEEQQGKVIDLGDGFYVIETIEQDRISRRGDTASGSKSGKVYQGSTLVGTATLYGIFDISGTSAKATDAEITGSGSNGWTYDHGTASCSGNKATGTAYFKANGVQKSLTLTLTCSPNGTLS